MFTTPSWNQTKVIIFIVWDAIFTPPRNRGGIIFSFQFVCVCVCLSGSACEQNSSRAAEPIWTRFSLNGCLLHWLEPYKGQRDVLHIFSSWFSVIIPTLYLSSLMFDQNEISYVAWYTLGQNSRSKVTDVKVSVFSECFLFWTFLTAI